MTRTIRIAVGALVGVAALALSALPAFSADTGTVNARVAVQAPAVPCITVSPTGREVVDFGTAAFQPAGQQAATVGSPEIILTSCTRGDVLDVLAHGTDATGTGGTWTLVWGAGAGMPVCEATPVTNQYNLGLRETVGTPSDFYLRTTDDQVASLGAGSSFSFTPILRMPCVGSSGAGETMAMSYVFTAVVQGK